jgi:hypothetical protein
MCRIMTYKPRGPYTCEPPPITIPARALLLVALLSSFAACGISLAHRYQPDLSLAMKDVASAIDRYWNESIHVIHPVLVLRCAGALRGRRYDLGVDGISSGVGLVSSRAW